MLPDYWRNSVVEAIPRKEAVVLVCCRSGNRSTKLAELGYANVYEFSGPYEMES